MRKKQQLRVDEIVKLFGGKHQIVADFSKLLRQKLTVKAVEKWKERESIPFQKLLDLREIAAKKQFNFVFEDYIKKVG